MTTKAKNTSSAAPKKRRPRKDAIRAEVALVMTDPRLADIDLDTPPDKKPPVVSRRKQKVKGSKLSMDQRARMLVKKGRGKSVREIAAEEGVSFSAVQTTKPEIVLSMSDREAVRFAEVVRQFEAEEDALQAEISHRLLLNMLEKASDPDQPLHHLASAYGTVTDKRNLKLGRATQIVHNKTPDAVAIEFLKALTARYRDKEAKDAFIRANAFGAQYGLSEDDRKRIAEEYFSSRK